MIVKFEAINAAAVNSLQASTVDSRACAFSTD